MYRVIKLKVTLHHTQLAPIRVWPNPISQSLKLTKYSLASNLDDECYSLAKYKLASKFDDECYRFTKYKLALKLDDEC